MPLTLDNRALNRALLARQLLLERVNLSPLDAIEHLVGLQAQAPVPPYVGLWSRLATFRPASLGVLLEDRAAVRMPLMRSTIHFVSRADALRLRPVVQSVLERQVRASYGRALQDVDRDALVARARTLLAAEPMVSSALGRRLQEWWPKADVSALANAARAWLPMVQTPPRGVWERSGRAVHAAADTWLETPLSEDDRPDPAVLRYLAVFGPATMADVQQWSGLTRLGPVLDRLRPRLATFKDERGRELFDVPDAPIPDPDTPAPVRLIAPFDNLVLSHADRSRIMCDEYRTRMATLNGMVPGTVLLDGFVEGAWRTTKGRRSVTLTLEPYRRWSREETDEVKREGERLLAFLSGGRGGAIEILRG